MSLFGPVLTTPLLKIPILLTRATIVQLACSPPPTPVAKSEEQRRFGRQDVLTRFRGEYAAQLMQVSSVPSELSLAILTQHQGLVMDAYHMRGRYHRSNPLFL